MPPVLTDILISMDDKYLYFSNWVHGDVRYVNYQLGVTDKFDIIDLFSLIEVRKIAMYLSFRQYDISDTRNPKLTGQVWLGGSITKEFGAKVIEDQELKDQPQARYIQGRINLLHNHPNLFL